MTDELYHDAIVSLAGRAGKDLPLDSPDGRATSLNPLCGDQVTVTVALDKGIVSDLSCEVKGCVLCKAACARLKEAASGMDLRALQAVLQQEV